MNIQNFLFVLFFLDNLNWIYVFIIIFLVDRLS